MKKVYKIEVDCASCAIKVQEAIKKIDGVNDASINFMTQKMILDIDESRNEEIISEVIKKARKVEPDFEVYK